MVDIVVIRGAGDYPGDDITEPLAASVVVARALGQSKIDEAERVDEVSLTAAYTAGLKPGQTLQVNDPWGSPTYQGKITRVRHVGDTDQNGNVSSTTEITVKKPREYR